MVLPVKLVQQIRKSNDFKQLLFANYIEHSNGKTMREYAAEEKKLLCMGVHSVEDHFNKINEYIEFLNWFVNDENT